MPRLVPYAVNERYTGCLAGIAAHFHTPRGHPVVTA